MGLVVPTAVRAPPPPAREEQEVGVVPAPFGPDIGPLPDALALRVRVAPRDRLGLGLKHVHILGVVIRVREFELLGVAP